MPSPPQRSWLAYGTLRPKWRGCQSALPGGGGAREDQGVEHSQSIPHLYLYKPHAQTWHAPMFVCLVLSRLMTHPCHFQNWWSPFMGHMFPEYVGLTPCLATRPTATTHSQLTKPCTASFAENTHTHTHKSHTTVYGDGPVAHGNSPSSRVGSRRSVSSEMSGFSASTTSLAAAGSVERSRQ